MPRLLIRNKVDGRIRKIDLTVNKFTIGKSPENDLVLARPGISSSHCTLYFYPPDKKFRIRDMGSSNGTYVDGARIESDTVLDHGTRIQIGEFEIQYKADRKQTESDLDHQEDLKRALADEGVAVEQTAPERSVSEEGGAIPVEIKKEIHEQLLGDRRLRHMDFTQVSEEEAREKTREVVEEIIKGIRKKIPKNISRRRLIREILDEALGLGPLEDLLSDSSVTEIMVNRYDRIYIERDGRLQLSEKRFIEDQQVVQAIQRIIAPIGRLINESSPMVDARLKDGSRVNAVISPLAVSGPSLTIRKFPENRLSMEGLISFGSLSPAMASFLELIVREHKNIIISGGTGSGKTTLLNVLGSYIPEGDRIVTVEDVAELQLPQDHVVNLETKPPNLEGEGAVEIRDLVRNSLRMRPDRIMVGECRGGEALDMLQAMNTGHDGSMTTLHANTPVDAMGRLETLVLMSGMDLPSQAIRTQISSAVDLVVQQTRLKDGARKVTYITEIAPLDDGEFLLQDIFRFQETGMDEDGKILGEYLPTGHIPDFVHEMNQRGVGVDMGIFGT
ncbi:MAG: ATPase, T2SS/T4P/T4SS family [Planctomycetota bacterium]|jgi:pilus assembly protein CpaF|nr:ATPase, T2SS/T4P/T4SS family [Planctomycetota bacterium]